MWAFMNQNMIKSAFTSYILLLCLSETYVFLHTSEPDHTALPCEAFPSPYSFIKIAPSNPKPSPDQIKDKAWQNHTICP